MKPISIEDRPVGFAHIFSAAVLCPLHIYLFSDPRLFISAALTTSEPHAGLMGALASDGSYGS